MILDLEQNSLAHSWSVREDSFDNLNFIFFRKNIPFTITTEPYGKWIRTYKHLINSSKSTRIVELEEELLYRQYPVDIVNNSTKVFTGQYMGCNQFYIENFGLYKWRIWRKWRGETWGNGPNNKRLY